MIDPATLDLEDTLYKAAEYWLDGHLNMDLSPQESMVGVLAKVMGDLMRAASRSMEQAGCPEGEIAEFEKRYQLWMHQILASMGEAFLEDVSAANDAHQKIKQQLEIAA